MSNSIFTPPFSDHFYPAGRTFRLYKHFVHEGGISTPLILHWPGHVAEPGSITHQIGQLTDIMATCVDVSGSEYPTVRNNQKVWPMEGRTLAPALSGKPLKNAVQYFEHEGNRAVRDGKWKIVAEGEDSPWELYDMEADRTEMNNLAGKHPDIVMRMDRLYRTWAVRTKVLPNKKPDDKGA